LRFYMGRFFLSSLRPLSNDLHINGLRQFVDLDRRHIGSCTLNLTSRTRRWTINLKIYKLYTVHFLGLSLLPMLLLTISGHRCLCRCRLLLILLFSLSAEIIWPSATCVIVSSGISGSPAFVVCGVRT
jgi:hypothetical protein